jgi:type IV pilus assembly protein PilY1
MNTKLIMNSKLIAAALVLALVGLIPTAARAQTPPSSCSSTNLAENFTGATTNCNWYIIGGACLTAGSTAASSAGSGATAGQPPACATDPYYNGVTLVGGNTGTLPDTVLAGGALRLTNDTDSESGAIISSTTFNSLATTGLQVTFTTETYEGDSGGANNDGADGISFFLQDASVATVTLGDWGGSLGYTCSNTNDSATQGYDGMIGAYVGLGIDEFGNFLNGTTVSTSGSTTTTFSAGADNTSSGYGYVPNRIGLRGAGATAWNYLSGITPPTASIPNNTSIYYPTSLNPTQQQDAVRLACQSGYAWDYRGVSSSAQPNGNITTNGFPNPYNAIPKTTVTIPNYAAIPNAYKVITNHLIANEGAQYRGYGTTATSGNNYGVPITYNLTISPGTSTSGSSVLLMSLSYSYDGGNYQPVITGQQVSNGIAPASVRFGFAGSTGGDRNIHEIMCFQAQPQNSASSSAGLNQKQTAKVQTGTQVYFAYYNSSNWTGSLTSQYLQPSSTDSTELVISPAVNWDASCVLTGLAGGAICGPTGQPNVAAENPDNGRVIWSWSNGTTPTGIAFTWGTGGTALTSTEQTNLNFGDSPAAGSSSTSTPTTAMLEYLRGVRTNEQNSFGYGAYTPTINPSGFRARSSVLGDIVDSSPTWVGPPSNSFPGTWVDALYSSETLPENSGQSYATFESTYQNRMNVVYAGANDGLMHGFRSGYFNNGTYVGTTNTSGVFVGTDNDGTEVLAYMPGYVVNTINSAEIAGTTTPNVSLDYASPQYAHRFSVDGTPGTGDLFYGSGAAAAWHTWLVSGLGAGGNAIFALDITNPGLAGASAGNFTQANAASGVIGEWSTTTNTTYATNPNTGVVTATVTGYSSTLTCTNISTCGASLGKTFGTPQIRRFHNNPASGVATTSWGAVFGNGGGSFKGDAGIYVMLANNSGPPTFYYLSTGVGTNYTQVGTSGTYTNTSGNPNGIYFVAPADLDGDHITDYVYAGDLQGNVWRFDLTSSNPSNWAVTNASGVAATSLPGKPIYSTGSSSMPITTQVVVSSVAGTPNPRILIEFGTGEITPFTNSSASTYSTSQQYLVGVWDWNLSATSTSWNNISSVKYASLTSTSSPAAPSSALSGFGSLQPQTITGNYSSSFSTSSTSGSGASAANNDYYRTVSSTNVCWPGTTGCSSPQIATAYGWYLALSAGYPNAGDPSGLLTSSSTGAPEIYEQVIFNPTLADGSFIVNTTIPPTTSLAQCSSTAAGGWTMALNPATGGAFSQSFFGASDHTFLNVNNQAISGIALGGTGSAAVVTGGSANYSFLVTQTVGGSGAIAQINPPGSFTGSRLTWIQRR